jgi:hypothetical protein
LESQRRNTEKIRRCIGQGQEEKMYKLTRPSGFDFYSNTINYRAAIGTTIRVTDYDPPRKGPCGKGLHASKNPNDCFVAAGIPCAAFRVRGIQKLAGDKRKSRYRALKVVEEIYDLDALFGWKYSEVIDPINPFKLIPPEIGADQVQLLRQWASLGDSVGGSVWASVRASVRDSVWKWNSVLDCMLDSVGDYVWNSVGNSVLDSVLDSVGNSVGDYVWDSVGAFTWAYVSSLFPNVKKWKGFNHEPGTNPFQSGIDLRRMGLVPSFDGKTWRLHGGPKAEILWR